MYRFGARATTFGCSCIRISLISRARPPVLALHHRHAAVGCHVPQVDPLVATTREDLEPNTQQGLGQVLAQHLEVVVAEPTQVEGVPAHNLSDGVAARSPV